MTEPVPPSRGPDPEAEQEVDFARYVKLLAVRWWLLAAGLVAGAVIGYLVSLGGSQVYSASATVYLGQPLSPTGGNAVITPQTNPSAIGQVINSQSVANTVANLCHLKDASLFKKGISSQTVATGASTKAGTAAQVSPLVKGIQTAIASASPSISDTDKLILQQGLRSDQLDRTTNSQLLLLATNVESPKVLVSGASHKITARSRRNTVVIGALIGLIIGALTALFWDRGAALLRD